jgi:hypothetical protein
MLCRTPRTYRVFIDPVFSLLRAQPHDHAWLPGMSDDPGEQPSPSDIDAAVAALQRRFPGVVVWYGRTTARWWALLPREERGHLIEARTPEGLAQAIAATRSWRRP